MGRPGGPGAAREEGGGVAKQGVYVCVCMPTHMDICVPTISAHTVSFEVLYACARAQEPKVGYCDCVFVAASFRIPSHKSGRAEHAASFRMPLAFAYLIAHVTPNAAKSLLLQIFPPMQTFHRLKHPSLLFIPSPRSGAEKARGFAAQAGEEYGRD